MSFNGQISGSLAPQGNRSGSLSGGIGAVVPDIRDGAVTTAKLADEAVTTAKLADAAVTIAKLAQDVTALINSKGSASDVAQLQEDVEALQTITAGLGTASTYGVANNLTQAAAGANVLDAYQGKVLNGRLTTAEGNITTLNDGYTNLLSDKSNKIVAVQFTASGLSISSGSTASYTLTGTIPSGYIALLWGSVRTNSFVGTGYISGYSGSNLTVWLHAFSGASSGSISATVLYIKQ